MDLTFEIANINCSYDAKKIVLRIEQLNIKKGEKVFFIGPSGIGKSTLLELLGLMSNTLFHSNGAKLNFYPRPGIEIDYCNLWQESDKIISKIRKQNFSFIFQQTNLMDSLSTYENVLISSLLEQENDFERSKNLCKTAIGRVFNKGEISKINNHNSPKELSGGQRQRLSFARAVAKNFTVLFADEPTGNLDTFNARNTMEQLSEIVLRTNATSIIVSHDIPLSVKYADKLVFISYDTAERCGFIANDNIYERNKEGEWSNLKGELVGMDKDMVVFLNEKFLNVVKDINNNLN
jgi:ABC-type lipoprotein export system ATPase subunit